MVPDYGIPSVIQFFPHSAVRSLEINYIYIYISPEPRHIIIPLISRIGTTEYQAWVIGHLWKMPHIHATSEVFPLCAGGPMRMQRFMSLGTCTGLMHQENCVAVSCAFK